MAGSLAECIRSLGSGERGKSVTFISSGQTLPSPSQQHPAPRAVAWAAQHSMRNGSALWTSGAGGLVGAAPREWGVSSKQDISWRLLLKVLEVGQKKRQKYRCCFSTKKREKKFKSLLYVFLARNEILQPVCWVPRPSAMSMAVGQCWIPRAVLFLGPRLVAAWCRRLRPLRSAAVGWQ